MRSATRSRRPLRSRTWWASASPSSHGAPTCLIDASGDAPVPPACPDEVDVVGAGLGTPGGDRPDATGRDELDADPRGRVDRPQVGDQLREVLDRVDVVVRRRADAAPGPAGLGGATRCRRSPCGRGAGRPRRACEPWAILISSWSARARYSAVTPNRADATCLICESCRPPSSPGAYQAGSSPPSPVFAAPPSAWIPSVSTPVGLGRERADAHRRRRRSAATIERASSTSSSGSGRRRSRRGARGSPSRTSGGPLAVRAAGAVRRRAASHVRRWDRPRRWRRAPGRARDRRARRRGARRRPGSGPTPGREAGRAGRRRRGRGPPRAASAGPRARSREPRAGRATPPRPGSSAPRGREPSSRDSKSWPPT